MVILKISANKKGLAPKAKIGLSHPINVPNHSKPNIYIVEVAIVSLLNTIKKLSSRLIIDAKKHAVKNPIKYPIVGPIKYKIPTPFSGEFENTGKPTIPSNKYNPIEVSPILYPKLIPKNRTTKVCIVIGTG